MGYFATALKAAQPSSYWKTPPMIIAGTSSPVHIDLGKDEPGMTLQCRTFEKGMVVWRDYEVDGKKVKSPVDIDALLAGYYRLV